MAFIFLETMSDYAALELTAPTLPINVQFSTNLRMLPEVANELVSAVFFDKLSQGQAMALIPFVHVQQLSVSQRHIERKPTQKKRNYQRHNFVDIDPGDIGIVRQVIVDAGGN